MTDWEDMALEAQLFPWLDSDCMSDINEEYMQQVIKEYKRIDDDPDVEDDFFDMINILEELDDY